MLNKEKTLDDFNHRTLDNTTYTANGRFGLNENGIHMIELNYSHILTKLIQEAGRWCRFYASDLFIDWFAIVKQLEDGTLESGSHLFGFRELGVDHTKAVLYHYNNAEAARYEYRALWRLDIVVEETESPHTHNANMKLYEVQR